MDSPLGTAPQQLPGIAVPDPRFQAVAGGRNSGINVPTPTCTPVSTVSRTVSDIACELPQADPAGCCRAGHPRPCGKGPRFVSMAASGAGPGRLCCGGPQRCVLRTTRDEFPLPAVDGTARLGHGHMACGFGRGRAGAMQGTRTRFDTVNDNAGRCSLEYAPPSGMLA